MKNFTNLTKNLAKRDGYVYTTTAIIFAMIISVVVVSKTGIFLQSVDMQTDIEAQYKAGDAAGTGTDLGLGLSADMSPGEEVEKSYICYTDGFTNPTIGVGTPPSNNPSCAKFVSTYEVKSLAGVVDGFDNSPSPSDDRYIVPPPGEGNAGENCIRPNNYNTTAHTVDQNILKPCNWNRLYYGKSVAIPLYISVPPNAWNPQGVINPVDLPNGPPGFGEGLGSLTIKVRTPCGGGHEYDNGNLVGSDEDDWCLSSTSSATGPDARPELADGEPANFNPTDIIVHWQIVSTCDYVPGTGNDGECIGMAVTQKEGDPSGIPYSDINKAAINFAKELALPFIQYAVAGNGSNNGSFQERNRIDDLNTVSPGSPYHPTIINYLKNINANPNESILPTGTISRTINRPVLYLSAVSPMTTDIDIVWPELNEYVPYIEYQIETDQPISDSNFTIRATGKYGNHSKSKKAKRAIFNAFPSFVFQN